ncbi:hypothetical protein ACUXCC_002604 [Cytobacillus horneckiae]|nr:hypothetical protein [Cytobacillus horneckiae]
MWEYVFNVVLMFLWPKRFSKASTPSKDKGTKPSNIGTSIVDYLKSKGMDSSFANREKLAEQHGIKNYKGTPEQNSLLLEKMQSGAKPVKENKPKENKPKGDMKTSSVVDYLKSINVDSSMANRKKLAKKHGIKNYKGTGPQNDQLLKKLRGYQIAFLYCCRISEFNNIMNKSNQATGCSYYR